MLSLHISAETNLQNTHKHATFPNHEPHISLFPAFHTNLQLWLRLIPDHSHISLLRSDVYSPIYSLKCGLFLNQILSLNGTGFVHFVLTAVEKQRVLTGIQDHCLLAETRPRVRHTNYKTITDLLYRALEETLNTLHYRLREREEERERRRKGKKWGDTWQWWGAEKKE